MERIQRQFERQTQREDVGDFEPGKVRYRISKSHGRLMMLVGLFFDLLPIILILFVIGIMFSTINGSVTEAACDDNWLTRILNYRIGSNERTWLDNTIGATTCEGATRASAAVAIIGGGFMLGPILYVVGSLFSVFTAFLVFLAWFGLKGTFILAPTGNRIAANLITMVVESLPLVNTLPGITLAVWRHVRISQKEDEKKHKEQRAKQVDYMNRQSRRFTKTRMRSVPHAHGGMIPAA